MNQDELKVLEDRIKANPKSRSFLQLAEAYIEAGRRKEALELLKNGEEYYPYYLAARIAYGKLLREEGETDRAIEQFEFVNRTIPDNLLALKNLAELYLDKDRIAESKSMAEAAMALSPSDPEMTEVLARIEKLSQGATASAPSPAPPDLSPPLPEMENKEETIVEMPHELFAQAAEERQEPSEPEHPLLAPPIETEETVPTGIVEPPAPEAPELPASEPEPVAAAQGSHLPQTETMADLLFDQGHLEEALEIYEAVLGRDPQSPTLPEKIRQVKTTLGMIEEPVSETVFAPAEEPLPAEEIVPPPALEKRVPEPEPESMETAPPIPEPEIPREPQTASVIPPVFETPAPRPEPVLPSAQASSMGAEGLTGAIIEKIRDRMGRDLIGYVRMTLDGLSAEASDTGHWADVLAAEGMEIVRAVTDMTRMLNWGELQGTVVWMEHAVLYGLPVDQNEALFLALKPGANVGLCRILVSQAIEVSRRSDRG